MKIIEYNESFSENLKDLLVELQSYLTRLDKSGIVTLKENYRDGYFDFIIKDVAKYNGKIFLAKKDGVAIGAIVCVVFQRGGAQEFTTTCPMIGYISDLIVTQSERGHGVGKMLVQRAEKYFTEKQCEYIHLEVYAPNVNAFEVYKKLGFNINCLYMSKKVSTHVQ